MAKITVEDHDYNEVTFESDDVSDALRAAAYYIDFNELDLHSIAVTFQDSDEEWKVSVIILKYDDKESE